MSFAPINITDCLTEAGLALEKGTMVLCDLTDKYPFDGDKDEYIEAWRFEYGRITAYMAIALDYMTEAATSVERARVMQKGGATA